MSRSKEGGPGADALVVLRPSVQRNAHIKLMTSGKAGSGKTTTSAKLVIAAMKRAGHPGPVAWFATEPGVDFVLPLFREAGIGCIEFRPYDLTQAERQRAGDFELLRAFIKGAIAARAQAIIIDSMTHVWDDFVANHGPQGPNTRPEDWAGPNKRWAAMLDWLATEPFHLAICTRAGDEWGMVAGKLGKTGAERSKIKAESDFEFSLILDMFRQGSRVVARVRKDRAPNNSMVGKEIPNPEFKDFEPVWASMAFNAPGPDDPKNSASGPESVAEATQSEDAPAGPTPRPDMFEGLELREGWSWPAEAVAYERPWGAKEHEEQANAAFLEKCAEEDRQKKRDQSGRVTLYQVVLACLRAGWSVAEIRKYVWEVEGWNKIALARIDELFAWLSAAAQARAKAFEEESK